MAMWDVQDIVARRGKLWVLYKRAGHRVLINARGDLIVRPSFAEASVQRIPGGVISEVSCSMSAPLYGETSVLQYSLYTPGWLTADARLLVYCAIPGRKRRHLICMLCLEVAQSYM